MLQPLCVLRVPAPKQAHVMHTQRSLPRQTAPVNLHQMAVVNPNLITTLNPQQMAAVNPHFPTVIAELRCAVLPFMPLLAQQQWSTSMPLPTSVQHRKERS